MKFTHLALIILGFVAARGDVAWPDEAEWICEEGHDASAAVAAPAAAAAAATATVVVASRLVVATAAGCGRPERGGLGFQFQQSRQCQAAEQTSRAEPQCVTARNSITECLVP